MKIAISLAALAAALIASPVMAQQATAPTAADAEAFLGKAEQSLFDQSIVSSRAAWINATYITDDTDAIASYFGAIDTKQRVDYALEAAKFATAPGLTPETKRRLTLLRTALTLREIEGLTYEEIAEAMDCPIGTVRSRIFRAREAIAERLRPLLGTAEGKRW